MGGGGGGCSMVDRWWEMEMAIGRGAGGVGGWGKEKATVGAD